MGSDERPKALALPRGGFLDKAEEVLYEAGLYGGDEEADGHYETTSARVGGRSFRRSARSTTTANCSATSPNSSS